MFVEDKNLIERKISRTCSLTYCTHCCVCICSYTYRTRSDSGVPCHKRKRMCFFTRAMTDKMCPETKATINATSKTRSVNRASNASSMSETSISSGRIQPPFPPSIPPSLPFFHSAIPHLLPLLPDLEFYVY